MLTSGNVEGSLKLSKGPLPVPDVGALGLVLLGLSELSADVKLVVLEVDTDLVLGDTGQVGVDDGFVLR